MADSVKLIGIAIDIVVVLFVLVAFLIGFKVGFLKVFRGLLASVTTILLAVVLVTTVTNSITSRVDWDERLTNSITPVIIKNISYDDPNLVIRYITEDQAVTNPENGEKIWGVVFVANDGSFHSIATLPAKTMLQRVILKLVIIPATNEFFSKNPSESMNLLRAISEPISTYFFMALVFILLAIVLRILIGIALRIIKAMISRLYLIHLVDRLIGGAVAATIITGVICLVLAIIKSLQFFDAMDPVITGIGNTTIVKLLYNANFMYDQLMLLKTFAVTALTKES
ncbi:MAG: hypothetical protein LBU04_05015 [Christensenellaceae bacterium]|jgi:hypothetical protein|nr:hypothetical protein [Christensenellaceae bacterium]